MRLGDHTLTYFWAAPDAGWAVADSGWTVTEGVWRVWDGGCGQMTAVERLFRSLMALLSTKEKKGTRRGDHGAPPEMLPAPTHP